MESTDQGKEGRDPWGIFGWDSRADPPWGLRKKPCPLDSSNSWILPHQAPLPSQGLQMEWPPYRGLLCLSSWPLLGRGPSRLGPWTGVSSPKTGPMLAALPTSFVTASTETCGNEASSSVLLASSGATSWSILVSLCWDLW